MPHSKTKYTPQCGFLDFIKVISFCKPINNLSNKLKAKPIFITPFQKKA